MRNLWKWALGFLGVILVTFFISTLFFRGSGLPGFVCGGFGLMGRGIGWGPGMMGGWGVLGGFGMLLMLLIPLGFIALLVAGAVVLVRSLSASKATMPTSPACSSCSRPVQVDWTTCPYCGKPLQ